jgi:crotonobetainyl-CoA:carnitine CoA-transferase CaiB-like acyl-CoA transferase
MRTVGPVAAAFGGQAEMSGLPEPAMPVGWGYSYLDWMGAYGYALAILGALYHRERTGEGQRIDASQCESGIFLTGPAILDWSANGRVWQRFGNRSPYKKAAPHGAYRCRGEDRWIALACFTESEWQTVARLAGLVSDPRFATLEGRLAHQDALDALVSSWTEGQDASELMIRLQQAGIPAGLCQTAEDRCDRDPQLAALEHAERRLRRVGPDALHEPARAVLEAAPEAAEVHVTTRDGAVFAVRDDRHAIVLACGRFALPALARYDLKVVLGRLAG